MSVSADSKAVERIEDAPFDGCKELLAALESTLRRQVPDRTPFVDDSASAVTRGEPLQWPSRGDLRKAFGVPRAAGTERDLRARAGYSIVLDGSLGTLRRRVHTPAIDRYDVVLKPEYSSAVTGGLPDYFLLHRVLRLRKPAPFSA